jgi:hypothetical protein
VKLDERHAASAQRMGSENDEPTLHEHRSEARIIGKRAGKASEIIDS